MTESPIEFGFDPRTVTKFVGGVLLWLILAGTLWFFATPTYNRFLTLATQNLCGLIESPNVTAMVRHDEHYAVITRHDLPPARQRVGSLRVTDIHFPVVLLCALFLAVPGVPWRTRLENLGWGLLALFFFQVLDFFLWTRFYYATQLGDWSLQNYGPFARNAWGLAKHIVDLPIKLALPFALWAAFYLGPLLREAGGKEA